MSYFKIIACYELLIILICRFLFWTIIIVCITLSGDVEMRVMSVNSDLCVIQNQSQKEVKGSFTRNQHSISFNGKAGKIFGGASAAVGGFLAALNPILLIPMVITFACVGDNAEDTIRRKYIADKNKTGDKNKS